jgi:ABC-2 type transport system ATP-binding protein
MSETVISLEGIKKSYGKARVLKGVDLAIEKGDIFGLVGKNGAGKTTIFKIILGLSEFQEGKLQVGGDGVSLEEGRKKIGFFVGSDFFPYLSARQNLEYYRELKGIRDKGEVERVLEIVDLSGAKGKFKNFSMGMRQRLGIANAIMGNPEILILDEPTNGLDPQGIADVRHLVKKLNTEFDMTIIISSHILGELQNTAGKFGIVNGGIIVRVITEKDLQMSDNTVRLKVEDAEEAREILWNAGIQILAEEKETRSLEDYYFNLLGGEDHA